MQTEQGQVEAYLDKANVRGVLAEALAAHIQVVLADDTTLVAAHTAAWETNKHGCSSGRAALAVVACDCIMLRAQAWGRGRHCSGCLGG